MSSDKLKGQTGFEFQFDSSACSSCRGRCCRGLGGYVWISPEEIKQMADGMRMDIDIFSKQFVRRIKGRLSLQERIINGEHFCCFFDPVDCRCSIYSERPNHCRTFPFWETFKKDYSKLLQECPGIEPK